MMVILSSLRALNPSEAIVLCFPHEELYGTLLVDLESSPYLEGNYNGPDYSSWLSVLLLVDLFSVPCVFFGSMVCFQYYLLSWSDLVSLTQSGFLQLYNATNQNHRIMPSHQRAINTYPLEYISSKDFFKKPNPPHSLGIQRALKTWFFAQAFNKDDWCPLSSFPFSHLNLIYLPSLFLGLCCYLVFFGRRYVCEGRCFSVFKCF